MLTVPRRRRSPDGPRKAAVRPPEVPLPERSRMTSPRRRRRRRARPRGSGWPGGVGWKVCALQSV